MNFMWSYHETSQPVAETLGISNRLAPALVFHHWRRLSVRRLLAWGNVTLVAPGLQRRAAGTGGDRRGWSLFRGCQGGFYRWVQYNGDIMGYTHTQSHNAYMYAMFCYIYIYMYILSYVMLYYVMLYYVMLCLFYVYVHVYVYVYAYVMLCHGMFSLCTISCLSKSYFMLSPWGF